MDYVYWNVAFQKYVRLEPGFQSGSIDYLDADRMALCLLLTKSCYPGGGGGSENTWVEQKPPSVPFDTGLEGPDLENQQKEVQSKAAHTLRACNTRRVTNQAHMPEWPCKWRQQPKVARSVGIDAFPFAGSEGFAHEIRNFRAPVIS